MVAHLVLVRPKARETHRHSDYIRLRRIHFFAAHSIPPATWTGRVLGVGLYGRLRRCWGWIVCCTEASESCAGRLFARRMAEAEQKNYVA